MRSNVSIGEIEVKKVYTFNDENEKLVKIKDSRGFVCYYNDTLIKVNKGVRYYA